ncbi:MAG: hypothetical protein CM15mP120_26610 [Pseudomonadota bacterium]|nr:MAG: hypothetical protein CM15mP120_26610 [Pseudomonadota bacterium]
MAIKMSGFSSNKRWFCFLLPGSWRVRIEMESTHRNPHSVWPKRQFGSPQWKFACKPEEQTVDAHASSSDGHLEE